MLSIKKNKQTSLMLILFVFVFYFLLCTSFTFLHLSFYVLGRTSVGPMFLSAFIKASLCMCKREIHFLNSIIFVFFVLPFLSRFGCILWGFFFSRCFFFLYVQFSFSFFTATVPFLIENGILIWDQT